MNGHFAKKLHFYQLEGVKFLYECVLGFKTCSENVGLANDDSVENVFGGILA